MAAAHRPKIGLLGGSFDPPHLAHLALGRCAQDTLTLDELRWLPAGAPWQKAGRQMAAAEHRAGMLSALLADQPQCVIDTREMLRDGATYTIDTVRELQSERPYADWFLILGQDQYARFDTWRDWPELLDRLTLAVAGRDGQAPQACAALAAHAHRMLSLPLARQDISASQIRQRLADGTPAKAMVALVGEAVAGYIDQHQPYPLGAAQENRH